MVTVFYSAVMLPLLAVLAGAAWFTNNFNIW